ncbi:MAG: hypothetical protein AB7S38_22695 [Vulcanimicrobiota bacterium]
MCSFRRARSARQLMTGLATLCVLLVLTVPVESRQIILEFQSEHGDSYSYDSNRPVPIALPGGKLQFQASVADDGLLSIQWDVSGSQQLRPLSPRLLELRPGAPPQQVDFWLGPQRHTLHLVKAYVERVAQVAPETPTDPDTLCRHCHGSKVCQGCQGSGVVVCSSCRGTKTCSACAGAGCGFCTPFNPASKSGKCSVCQWQGYTAVCSICTGSKKCFYCGGTGLR